MNFQIRQARFKRLFQESTAWRLLRADNAPYILAFVEEVFAESSEVPYSRARVLLDGEIERSRESGVWQTETSALAYLNQWIKQGWLREMDGLLSRTDAAETALRFARTLDERTTGATASHLRIVQDAVRDFAIALSRNADERAALLQAKRAEIERELADLQAGVWADLDTAQMRERVREIHQLSLLLTGDFRFFEDEIRALDKALRVQMLGNEAARGEVLRLLLDKEAWLDGTEAGSAFNGFFELLVDVNRATEFREQLRVVLDSEAAAFLSPAQFQYLSRLIPLLSQESERVFRIRRRTGQELRVYIESGAAAENRAVDGLLSALERSAVALREGGCDLQTPLALSLPTGSVSVASPDSMRLRWPDEGFVAGDMKEHVNRREAGDAALASLEMVRIRELAGDLRALLHEHGALTLAGLAEHRPITMGMEELLGYFRVARAVGAVQTQEYEAVLVRDKSGGMVRAQVPVLHLSAGLFPADLDSLAL